MTAETSTHRVKPVNIEQPAIPVSRNPIKPKLKFKRGWIPHVITILLLSLNISLLILSYVGAADVSSNSSTSSMADGLYMFVVHRPFNVGGKELDDAAVRAIPRYGLSPFQACRFSMRKEDLESNGTCVGSEWALKGSLDGLDAGDKLELSDPRLSQSESPDTYQYVSPPTSSDSIIKALPMAPLSPVYADQLTPLVVILNLTHLFLLIRAYKRPVHIAVLNGETYPTDGSSPQDLVDLGSLCRYTSSSKKATYATAAFRGPQEWYIRLRTYDVRDFCIAPLSLGLGGILLIMLLCAYKGGSEEVQVDAGLALQVFLVAIIIQPLVTFIPWLLGLKVYQKGSDKNKNYNTSCFSAYNGKSKTGYYAQFEA